MFLCRRWAGACFLFAVSCLLFAVSCLSGMAPTIGETQLWADASRHGRFARLAMGAMDSSSCFLLLLLLPLHAPLADGGRLAWQVRSSHASSASAHQRVPAPPAATALAAVDAKVPLARWHHHRRLLIAGVRGRYAHATAPMQNPALPRQQPVLLLPPDGPPGRQPCR